MAACWVSLEVHVCTCTCKTYVGFYGEADLSMNLGRAWCGGDIQGREREGGGFMY